MAYLELSKMGYEALIKAAANKAGSVAKVCNEQGIWGPEADAEAPVGVATEVVIDESSIPKGVLTHQSHPEPQPKFQAQDLFADLNAGRID